MQLMVRGGPGGLQADVELRADGLTHASPSPSLSTNTHTCLTGAESTTQRCGIGIKRTGRYGAVPSWPIVQMASTWTYCKTRQRLLQPKVTRALDGLR